MNVTELARKLKVNTKTLLEVLPEYGFDIGKKAIKIDDRTAEQVMRRWRHIKRDLDEKRRKEEEENKKKEREMRRESGQTVELADILTVRLFAERLNLPITQVITELMKNGILANQNQDIDYDTAAIIAEELGFAVQKEETKVDVTKELEKADTLDEVMNRGENKERRAPVVVVMGHVDHGKTTLLDSIRKENIAAQETGGITQHIGAYQTIWKDPKTKEERAITFIDTPGHEAFTVMRSRGATVADIAILVVSADDGVKPQTEEVIQIVKAAKLPLVVAINKIDKDGADPQRAKTELSQHGVIAEEWGGDVPMVEISAKQHLNIDKLLDTLLLVTDMNADEIMADPSVSAAGTVVESHLDKSIGPVATLLIQSGTLHKGDPLVVRNEIYGRVRAMKDYKGDELNEAGPSVPVQIIGFKVAPEVGDVLDLSKAQSAEKIDVKQKRTQQTGAQRYQATKKESEEEEEESVKTLNLVIKADVLGSLEAIIGSLEKMRFEGVSVRIIGKGLGNINEDDINKAEAGRASVVGFHVKPTARAEESMRDKNIPFKRYDVIYDLINWVKAELEQLLEWEKIITELGTITVLAIFRKDKRAMTIGGRVETGKIKTGSLVRVKRAGELVDYGKLVSLQIGQQVMKEVPSGTECGMRYEGRAKIEKGDILEAYMEESKARTLQAQSK